MKPAVFLLAAAALLAGGCAHTEPASKQPQRTAARQKQPERRADGYQYRIKTAAGQCLEHSRSNHKGITAYACQDQSNQRFAVSGNSIRVEGLCLDAHGNNKKDGAKVTARACHGKTGQQWYRDGQTIRSSLNGKCLDAGKYGSQIRLHRCDGSRGQRFSFTR